MWQNWALLNFDALSIDGDGSQCALGQPFGDGNVFFLGGILGSGSVTRTECQAPENKFLFFPFYSSNAGIFPVVEPGPGIARQEIINPNVNEVTSLNFTFDGQQGSIPGGGTGFTYSEPVTADLFAYRAGSPPGGAVYNYSVLAGPNICPTCPADGTLPGVTGGYWLLLAPPTPGEHEVKFFAGSENEQARGLPQDITYDPLTIADCH